MKFTKWHGLGNDFIIPEEVDITGDLSALAVKLCDRHFGVGADGLCLLETSELADIRMRLLNSDGSEAEMCGNLMRCLSKYMYEAGMCRKKNMRIETLAGTIKSELVFSGNEIVTVRVDMGSPKTKRGDIPMFGRPDEEACDVELSAGGRRFTGRGISMGNPHFVIFVEDLSKIDIAADGRLIENNSLFPTKTNVEFAQVINRQKIRMRVWERGAGATLACGTGACATAAAGMLNQLVDESVEIVLDGGSLFLEWPGKSGSVFMNGPAEKVFAGEVFLR